MEATKTILTGTKSNIVQVDMTMSAVKRLSDEYGWSSSVPNLFGKLKRGSLRCGKAVELAKAPRYETIEQKRNRQNN